MILMHFLHKQGEFDKNSTNYLRKIQHILGEKDAKSNELIIFKHSLKIIIEKLRKVTELFKTESTYNLLYIKMKH